MASRSAKKATSKHIRKTAEHLYDAQGAPEAGEAMDDTPGMKKGGRAHKKHGGHVEGHKGKMRADHKARGGKAHHKRAAGGRTPYTSGHMTSSPSESGKTDSGHEGQRPG